MCKKWSRWIVVNALLIIVGLFIVSCEEKVTPSPPINYYFVNGQVLNHAENGVNYPVEGAKVWIGGNSVYSGYNGFFAVTQVPAGEQDVRVEKSGFVTLQQKLMVNESLPETVTLWLTKTPVQSRNVSGQVFYAVNQVNYPIESAHVTIADKSDETDAQGQFTVVGVPYGQQQMRVERVGYVTAEQSIDVNQEMPSSITVPVTPVEDPIVFTYETASLDPTLNGTNYNQTMKHGRLTTEQMSERVIEGARQTASGFAKVIKVSKDLNGRLLTVAGKTIRVSNVASAAALALRIANSDFFSPGEAPEVVYEIRLTDGTDRVFFIQPNQLPSTATGRTMYDWERDLLIESKYELRLITTNGEELRFGLRDLFDASADLCTFYTAATFFASVEGAPVIVLACAGIGSLQMIDGVWTVITTQINPNDRFGLYVRRPSVEFDVTDPFLCVAKMPDPGPPPYDQLWVQPESFEMKLGYPAKQFEAIAHTGRGEYVNVTYEGTIWELEGLTGTINGGLFTPWQAGNGYIVATLPVANLTARSAVTVRPANRPPECTIWLVLQSVTDPTEYSIHCRLTDPDGDSYQSIRLEYGDGQAETIANTDVNSLGEFVRSHRYSPGNWTIRLTATDVDGATCETSYSLVINPPQNVPPTSNPSCPGNGYVNASITVVNNATDPDGTVTEYRCQTQFEDITQESKTFHLTFTYPGSYLISFWAKDDDNAWGPVATCAIEIGEPQNVKPTACFSISPTTGNSNTPFTFDAGCSSDDNDPVSELWKTWQIDNGSWTPLNQANTYQTTLSVGTHTIALKVKDSDHVWSDPVSQTLTVTSQENHPPQAILSGPSTSQTDQPITVNPGYSDPDGDPMWFGAFDWGDGSGIEYIYAIAPVDHTYTVQGTYSIRFTVMDDHNNWSETAIHTVTISNPVDPLTIRFTVCPSTGQPNVPVHFEVEVTGGVPPYQVHWQPLGQNAITTSAWSLDWTYLAPMSTYMQAWASDSQSNQSNTAQCNVSIDTGAPTVSCSLTPNPAETNQNVTATAIGSDDDTDWSQVQVRWQKEAGAAWTAWTTAKSDVLTYATAGIKTVTVEAKDKWGKVASSTCTVQVNEPQITTGTIKVRSNITAGFTITGPVTLTGTTPKDFADKPPGSYTISWNAVAGYVRPANETKILTAGGTIEFYGYYEYPGVDFVTQTLGPYTLQQSVIDRVEAEGGPAGATYSFYWTGAPPGLSLASNGIITGTPIQLGTFNTTITVTVNGWSGFDKTEVFPITVQDVTPSINVWPPSLDFETSVTERQFYIERASGGMPIHFYVTSSDPKVTVYPTEGYTDMHVTATVHREGQASGNYQATITVTPVGGVAKTVTAIWAVGCNDYEPIITGPADGATVSLRNLTFSWTCFTTPCRTMMIEIYEHPGDPSSILHDYVACEDLSWYYNPDFWHILQPNRTYYWWICIIKPNNSIDWCSTVPEPYLSFTTTP